LSAGILPITPFGCKWKLIAISQYLSNNKTISFQVTNNFLGEFFNVFSRRF